MDSWMVIPHTSVCAQRLLNVTFTRLLLLNGREPVRNALSRDFLSALSVRAPHGLLPETHRHEQRRRGLWLGSSP